MEVSKALTRTTTIDALLEQMPQFTFRLLDVDFVTLWIYDDAGVLAPRISRTRDGSRPRATSAPRW